MIRIGRYAGAILIEHAHGQILVGNPKEPCAVTETIEPPYTLPLVDKLPLSGCALLVEHDNPRELSQIIAQKMVIQRNGSVSERLWRLVTNQQSSGELRAQWLVDVPAHVWDVVRDTVLRCS
jgi:hypothetical protein